MLPTDFLTFADAVLKTLPCPAGFRSVVSRAYYAAHHHIKVFVEGVGVTLPKTADAHTDLCRHLAEINDVELEMVGTGLSQLRSDRNEADYDLLKTQYEKSNNASDRVAEARDLMKIVDDCLADKSRYEKVKAAIRKRNRFLYSGANK